MVVKTVLITVVVVVGVLSVAVSLGIMYAPLRFSHKSSNSKRVFTPEELANYNGTDTTLPILLAILGSMFDVTKGKSHYGPGGGYSHFSGRIVRKWRLSTMGVDNDTMQCSINDNDTMQSDRNNGIPMTRVPLQVPQRAQVRYICYNNNKMQSSREGHKELL